jgi:enamine deaminase RidA (YjgF/YER057c/UK114 family)
VSRPPSARKVATTTVPGAPPPFRRYYSNAVRATAGDLLFVSGQVAWDEDGRVVCPGDGPGQARRVFDNLTAVLAAHGATLDDLVKITVFVTDLSWFAELSGLRETLFPADGPASTIVQVSALVQPELLIEVEAVAVIG